MPPITTKIVSKMSNWDFLHFSGNFNFLSLRTDRVWRRDLDLECRRRRLRNEPRSASIPLRVCGVATWIQTEFDATRWSQTRSWWRLIESTEASVCHSLKVQSCRHWKPRHEHSTETARLRNTKKVELTELARDSWSPAVDRIIFTMNWTRVRLFRAFCDNIYHDFGAWLSTKHDWRPMHCPSIHVPLSTMTCLLSALCLSCHWRES